MPFEWEENMETRKNANVEARKRLYTIKELVKFVGATEWFWRTQIWDGSLPFIKVGSKMLVDRDDVDRFIAQNKQSNAVI